MATVYQAGDSAGWTRMGQVDSKDRAANKSFYVGDTVVFESCNATSLIATYTSGSDGVTFEKHGHFYFICGYAGHRQAG